MRKKKILTFIIIVVLIAACVTGVLLWRGVISFGKDNGAAKGAQTAAAYLAGEEEYITIDIEGNALSKGADEPADIPKITGIEFSNAEPGCRIDWGNTDDFDYVAEILEALEDTEIQVNEIIVDESGQVTLISNGLKILLGKNEKTTQKIMDLNDFISELSGKKGTVNMKEVNDTLGYSFRPEPETVTQAETTAAPDSGTGEENAEGNENPEGNENSDDGSENGEESWDEGAENGEESWDDGSGNGEESWDDGNNEESQNEDG